MLASDLHCFNSAEPLDVSTKAKTKWPCIVACLPGHLSFQEALFVRSLASGAALENVGSHLAQWISCYVGSKFGPSFSRALRYGNVGYYVAESPK